MGHKLINGGMTGPVFLSFIKDLIESWKFGKH